MGTLVESMNETPLMSDAIMVAKHIQKVSFLPTFTKSRTWVLEGSFLPKALILLPSPRDDPSLASPPLRPSFLLSTAVLLQSFGLSWLGPSQLQSSSCPSDECLLEELYSGEVSSSQLLKQESAFLSSQILMGPETVLPHVQAQQHHWILLSP